MTGALAMTCVHLFGKKQLWLYAPVVFQRCQPPCTEVVLESENEIEIEIGLDSAIEFEIEL